MVWLMFLSAQKKKNYSFLTMSWNDDLIKFPKHRISTATIHLYTWHRAVGFYLIYGEHVLSFAQPERKWRARNAWSARLCSRWWARGRIWVVSRPMTPGYKDGASGVSVCSDAWMMQQWYLQIHTHMYVYMLQKSCLGWFGWLSNKYI